MAIMLQNGLGCMEDTDKAYEFMLKSAQNGFALAQHAIGFMYFEGECIEKDII